MDHKMQRRVVAIVGSIVMLAGGVGQAFAAIEEHCSTPGTPIPIPDHNGSVPGMLSDTISLTSGDIVSGLSVTLDASHGWVGDLNMKLQHDTGTTVVLLDRPGFSGQGDCDAADINAGFTDDALSSVEDVCPAANTVSTISGSFTPLTADFLANFDGDQLGGNWVLSVTDSFPTDTGSLNQWCISATLTTPPFVCNDAAMPYSGRDIISSETLVCDLTAIAGAFDNFDVLGTLTINAVSSVTVVGPVNVSGNVTVNAGDFVSIDGPFSVTGTLAINMVPAP